MRPIFPECRFIHAIDEILNDREIEGVFVCASPSAHFEILRKLLMAGKKVFIEKPPCRHLHELEQLTQNDANAICKVGLQRRYWRGNKEVFKIIPSAKSYCYTFHFGTFIQGDPFTDLFIHALDYCAFLFGKYKVASSSKQKDGSGITIQLHVMHLNGISGLIELSTHFSWNVPSDIMTIHCKNESLIVQYPLLVKGNEKPRHLFNIPSERLMNQPLVTKQYFSAHSLIIPTAEVNTLVLQGFYNEVKAFIEIAEGWRNDGIVQNDLPGLKSVYEIIEELRGSA